MAIFYIARCVRKHVLYRDVIHLFDWKSAVEHDGIPAFVMYCVNGESGSSILIESTDCMI